MHSIEQEGDIRTIKARETLKIKLMEKEYLIQHEIFIHLDKVTFDVASAKLDSFLLGIPQRGSQRAYIPTKVSWEVTKQNSQSLLGI